MNWRCPDCSLVYVGKPNGCPLKYSPSPPCGKKSALSATADVADRVSDGVADRIEPLPESAAYAALVANVRRETIEACARVVESMTAHTDGERAMRYDAAAHVRALASPKGGDRG